MADPASSQPITSGIPRIRDPEFREVYANASLTALSPFDITLTFAKSSDVAGQAMQIDQVSVTVSPQHFKALCGSLVETLKAYEASFGELTIPDSDIRPLRDAEQMAQLIKENRDKTAAAREALISSSTEKKPPGKRSRAVRKH
jgi:hypothetical protein